LRSNHRAYGQPLKGWRRVATRYEKREVNYLAMVTIAAIVLLWLE
jgi:transposase